MQVSPLGLERVGIFGAEEPRGSHCLLQYLEAGRERCKEGGWKGTVGSQAYPLVSTLLMGERCQEPGGLYMTKWQLVAVIYKCFGYIYTK